MEWILDAPSGYYNPGNEPTLDESETDSMFEDYPTAEFGTPRVSTVDRIVRVTVIPIPTITFDARGGTVDPADATTLSDRTLASLPTPTRPNFTFNGWFTAPTGGVRVTIDTVFDGDTTIYAQWTAVVVQQPPTQLPPPVTPPTVAPPPSGAGQQRTVHSRRAVTPRPPARVRDAREAAQQEQADVEEQVVEQVIDTTPRIESFIDAQGQATLSYRVSVDLSVYIYISVSNILDGTYVISLAGLPDGVLVPENVVVIEDLLRIELLGITEAMVGLHNIVINLYDSDGNVLATNVQLVLTIGDPVIEQVEQPPVPLPEQPAVAVTVEATVVRFAIGSAQYTSNGMQRTIVDQVAPFIDPVYERTMLPIRAVAESLGAVVTWDDATRTVIIVGNGVTLTIPVDSPLPGGMGMPVMLDGRTFVPLRYVSEMLGADVRWDNDARAVYVLLQ
jgi:uncharacterized repeat protein (TIGR02543 family)